MWDSLKSMRFERRVAKNSDVSSGAGRRYSLIMFLLHAVSGCLCRGAYLSSKTASAVVVVCVAA